MLYLLPSAPQDLVVDVYWHLVRRRNGDSHDAGNQGELRRLNEAYAALLAGPDVRGDAAPPPTEDVSSRARVDAKRARGRPTTDEPVTFASPWEQLHVVPDAPTDVVDLAYEYWKVRLRGQTEPLDDAPVERLRAAYQAIRAGTHEALSPSESVDNALAPEAAPDVASHQALVSAGGEQGPSARAPSVSGWGRTATHVTSAGLRVWTPRVWRLACAICLFFGRWSAKAARMAWRALRTYGPPAWRAVRRGSLASARWVVRRSVVLGTRLLGETERATLARDADERNELAPDPGVEERFAALAASRSPDTRAR